MKKQEQTDWKSNKEQPKKQMLYIYIYICVCVCFAAIQTESKGWSGWKGGLQNECQFIEA